MRSILLWLCPMFLWTTCAHGQEKDLSQVPKTDWSMDHNVVLAIAAAKGDEVRIRLTVPMWHPKPGLQGDPGGPEDFVCSPLRSILQASDVRVYRKNGKVVEAKELPTLLPKDTHVLWSASQIDPYYLMVMRDDVLIVVVEFEKIINASRPSAAPASAPGS